MNAFFLKLLSVPTDNASRVVDGEVALRGGGYLGWVFLLAVLLGGLAVWSYWKTARDVPPVRRYGMAALRALFLALLLVLLLRPVFRYTVEGTVRRSLLMLVDTSASMKIADPRTDDADLKRVAIARGTLDATRGLDQPLGVAAGLNGATRLDVVKAGLKNDQMNLVRRLAGEYDLRPMSFGQGIADIAAASGGDAGNGAAGAPLYWVDRLDAPAPSTALGDGVRDAVLRSRGQPLAGVWVITDGQSNAGSAAVAAAEVARQEGVPLYLWGVGIASPKDVVVASMFAQEVAFLKDAVPVVVRVKGQNLQGRTAKLKLSLSGTPVDVRDVKFTGEEQVIAMQFTPDKPGEFELTATIDPQADEAVKDNNTVSQRVRVIDRKIKVLVVETSPRWEFKYLQAALMRDRRVEAKFLLLEADASVASGPNSPYLSRFPQDKQDLFKYDLLVLGDVDPRAFAQQQLEAVREFVDTFGGGLLVIAGRQHGPGAWRGTPVANMLPVDPVEGTGGGAGGAGGSVTGRVFDDTLSTPIPLELTPAGLSSQFMRLTDREQDNAALWAKLPPLYWAADVAGAKPGAEVLAVDPTPRKGAAGRAGQKSPVFALQQYGLGQVFYAGTDNTWRWRKNGGDARHVAFWGQVVQRLALPHLLGESKRTQLTADRANYYAGDKVTIYARLYDTAFQAVDVPEVKGAYASADGRTTANVTLRPLPDQKGMYRGEFVAPPQGQYEFSIDRDDRTKLALNVGASRIELSETAMNERVLRDMAAASGGAFFREEDLIGLPDAVRAKAEGVKSRQEVELWSSPAYFLLLMGVVSTEWIFRKLAQLK